MDQVVRGTLDQVDQVVSTCVHSRSRSSTNVTACDAHLGWNATQPSVEDAWDGCNHELRNIILEEPMVHAEEVLGLTRSTLHALVLIPNVWCFGRWIDRHDDPTPNREIAKKELVGNADVQSTVVIRDDQLLRR